MKVTLLVVSKVRHTDPLRTVFRTPLNISKWSDVKHMARLFLKAGPWADLDYNISFVRIVIGWPPVRAATHIHQLPIDAFRRSLQSPRALTTVYTGPGWYYDFDHNNVD